MAGRVAGRANYSHSIQAPCLITMRARPFLSLSRPRKAQVLGPHRSIPRPPSSDYIFHNCFMKVFSFTEFDNFLTFYLSHSSYMHMLHFIYLVLFLLEFFSLSQSLAAPAPLDFPLVVCGPSNNQMTFTLLAFF